MRTAPDHPDITTVACTGYLRAPWYPICPICGGETGTFIKSLTGEILGCDNCTAICDAWEDTAWES